MTQLAMIAVAPVAASFRLTPVASAADDTAALTRLLTIVNAPADGSSPADREEAALQLVNRGTADSKAQILAVLKNNTNPNGQVAIALALATVPHPDEALIPVLAGLLGSNRALTEAAANALANYPGNAAALDQLKKFADIAGNPNPVRISVIHAMGALTDQSAAAYLFNLMGQSNQNPAIQNAAMEALGEMTGNTDFGIDLRQWKQWWAVQSTKNPDQFRAMILETRARQFKLIKQHDQELIDSAHALLISDYLALAPEKRPAVLLAYLSDHAPEVRNVGVQLVRIEFAQKPPSPKVRQILFQLIGDSDDKVRSDVADVLLTLNDSASLNALIDQLAVEKNPIVARKIAQTLGNLKDPTAAAAAAGALIPMLHQPNLETATAAAHALANLGENLRQKEPALADDLSSQIRRMLDAINNQPGTDSLRAACVLALASLRDPKSIDTFLNCFKPGETAEVRKAALIGMGKLNDLNADQTVANQLGDSDPSIRLEAARALATVATPGQDGIIFDRMNSDRDPEVRQALWIAFQKLLDKLNPGQLEGWAAKFSNDPGKKIITLEKLSDVLKRGKDAQQVAFNEQAIADAMMLVKPVPQTTEAIGHLQQALDYWRGPGKGTPGSGENLETLIGQMLDVKLQAEQWSSACTFAADQITFDDHYRQTVGPRIKDKVDELVRDGKPDAQKLIDAALAMKPALDPKYVKMIQDAQAQLKQSNP